MQLDAPRCSTLRGPAPAGTTWRSTRPSSTSRPAEGRAFLRLYRWEPLCLSFGRHEPALRRYDRGAHRALGTRHRPPPDRGAGGLARRRADLRRGRAGSQRSARLRRGLPRIHAISPTRCGRSASRAALAPRRRACSARWTPAPVSPPPPAARSCCRGRKVVGSAQLRQGGAFLQHGSILLEDDQSLMRQRDARLGAVPAAHRSRRVLGRDVFVERPRRGDLTAAATRWGAGTEPGLIGTQLARRGSDTSRALPRSPPGPGGADAAPC